MTIFNPSNKSELTDDESLGPAMKITEQWDAEQYFRDYVAYIKKHFDDDSINDITAEDIAKQNLGYYAGYYDNKTRERVERLFSCEHPIFGSIKNGSPTFQDAFNAGVKYAENNKLRWLRKEKLQEIEKNNF